MTIALASDFFRHMLGPSQPPSSGADDIHVLYGTLLAHVSETSGVRDKFFRLCSPVRHDQRRAPYFIDYREVLDDGG